MKESNNSIDTIIFDLGGVLIDWNPRYLYRKIFKTEEEITWFLENICTAEWNDQQDAGRSFEEATELLVKQFPDHEFAIRAWYGRWEETILGPIHDTVKILEHVKNQKQHRLYALTNWSAETFPWALQNFEFLHWFEGMLCRALRRPESHTLSFTKSCLIAIRLVLHARCSLMTMQKILKLRFVSGCSVFTSNHLFN
jgi:hypothetical protein